MRFIKFYEKSTFTIFLIFFINLQQHISFIVSTPSLCQMWGTGISTILWKGQGFEVFRGRGLEGKRVVNFCRKGAGFLEVYYKFHFTTLTDLLLTCRMKDNVSLVVFHLCFQLISFIKSFLIVFYFIDSVIRGKVSTL